MGRVDEARETPRRQVLVRLGLGAVDLAPRFLQRGIAGGAAQQIFTHLPQGRAGAVCFHFRREEFVDIV